MEEIKFKNTSRMDANEISIFQSLALKKTTMLVSVLFALLFVGAGVGLAFWDLTVGIVMGVCGIAGGFFFLPYLLKENQRKQNLQLLGDRKYLNTFEFFEDYFLVSSSATENAAGKEYFEVGTQHVNYQEVYKVVTYKDRLFIFINQTQSFILNFKGMTTGTVAELVEFLKEKNIQVEDKSKVDTTPKKK